MADTNFCLRVTDSQSPMFRDCNEAFLRLNSLGHPIGVPTQVLVEFWAVVTRPIEANGFGWAPARAEMELTRLEQRFVLLPEDPDTFRHWRQLVNTHSIKGKRTHDARIAAAMLTYGVTHILTFNGHDFAGFPHLTVLDPRNVASGAALP